MTKPSFFNQAALVDDLWNEMTTTGFSNRSKNDFYDFGTASKINGGTHKVRKEKYFREIYEFRRIR